MLCGTYILQLHAWNEGKVANDLTSIATCAINEKLLTTKSLTMYTMYLLSIGERQ